jgi:hypothetical protein
MLIVETAVAVTLLCAATRRQRIENSEYSISSSVKTHLFQVASGRTLEGDMREELQGLPNVSGVTVKRNGNLVSVDVELSQFDRASRRRIYSKERELAKYYPAHVLDVRLIDCSERSHADADQG